MIFLTNLADRLEIAPIKAAKEKIEVNIKKYPVEKTRGRSDKYPTYFKIQQA